MQPAEWMTCGKPQILLNIFDESSGYKFATNVKNGGRIGRTVHSEFSNYIPADIT
jgi:hypothetical protein